MKEIEDGVHRQVLFIRGRQKKIGRGGKTHRGGEKKNKIVP